MLQFCGRDIAQPYFRRLLPDIDQASNVARCLLDILLSGGLLNVMRILWPPLGSTVTTLRPLSCNSFRKVSAERSRARSTAFSTCTSNTRCRPPWRSNPKRMVSRGGHNEEHAGNDHHGHNAKLDQETLFHTIPYASTGQLDFWHPHRHYKGAKIYFQYCYMPSPAATRC